uniref:Ribosome production factor 2 homolog n=1 Tax=Peronospora matthiolae TaxID=2874970 RepID=A0AAV1UG93_9STRA
MAGGGKSIKNSASKQAQRATKKVTKQAARTSRKVTSFAKPKRLKAYVQRALKAKEPKLVENTKNLLVLRGKKTNEDVNELLCNLRMLKAPDATFMGKKNDIHVFDDENKVEFLTQKNDASLFLVGSSTKKRPNNLVLGRTFDGHILDVVELGFCNFKPISAFKCKSKKAPGSKPSFVFTGDQWESVEAFMKLKNMLLDTFRGTIVRGVNVKGLDHVIVCTAWKETVLFRSYSIDFKKGDESHPRVELDEMGPRFDLQFCRTKFASADAMKAATKKPKGLVPKKKKNISRDELTGDKLGRIHMDHQDVYSMQSRRVKALRKTPADLKNGKGAGGGEGEETEA